MPATKSPKASFHRSVLHDGVGVHPGRALAAGLFLTLVSALSARAATFAVTTTADGNHGACTVSLCTLRDAVIAANLASGSTITLPSNGSHYTLTLTGANEDAAATGDLDVTANLTINGGGAATTIIDGNGTDRVFQLIGAVTLTLNGVTVTNGNTTTSSNQAGGGILTPFSGGGGLVLNNSVVTGNNGADGQGGGIFANSVTLTNSTVSQNTTIDQGGGIFATSATITNSTVSNNSSTGDQGGGLFLENGSSTITASTISGNSSASDGGGIYLNGSINQNAPALLTITNSTISGNNAPDAGGIFILSFATVTITGSTFTVNGAASGGGAGILNDAGLLTLTNCTFNQNGINGGTQGGTGIFNNGGSTTITNCTIDSNSMLSGPGAAIANGSGTVTLKNTIIEANNGGNCSGTIVDGGGNQQSPGTTCGATIPTRSAILQALGDNGGPTQTQALGSGSPALNAAVGCPPPNTDQRGISRPQGSACDIGAFECQTGECGLGAVTNTPTSTPTNTPAGVATATPTNTPTTVAATPTRTATPIAGVVVPTLSFPLLALLGLALAGAALLLLRR